MKQTWLSASAFFPASAFRWRIRSVSAIAGTRPSGRGRRTFAGILTSSSSIEPAPITPSIRFCSSAVFAM